jgi:tetratricopeptide (TPR) repeat protein
MMFHYVSGETCTMRPTQSRLRTLLIATAIIALVLAAWVGLVKMLQPLQEFYGPDGTLERQRQINSEIVRGGDALREGRFQDAEARYRESLRLAELSKARDSVPWYGASWVGQSQAGLADALTGQGRYAEAEKLYKKALEAEMERLGPHHLIVADVLDRYGACLRGSGRASVAQDFESRAKAIREELTRHQGELEGRPKTPQTQQK